jgi:hypothetical protein
MPGRGAAVAIALLLSGVALAVAGCGLGPGAAVGRVGLTVTREFGAVKLAESSGEANESDTVMRFLESEAEIETSYGGGFVRSIDGVTEAERSGHPYDWFFYVDGVLSPVGAAAVSLEGGERIWWDNHDWSASEQVPAVVGSWPAPFTTGWEGHAPVVAVECEGGGAACGEVTAALEREGAKVAKDAAKEAIRVLVGPWAKLRSDPAAGLVGKGPGESGVYAEFVPSQGTWQLVGLDEDGKKARTFGAGTGLVAATRRFEGSPVWIVTGGSAAAVRAAAASLNTHDLRDHYAVASEAGVVTPLPLRSR